MAEIEDKLNAILGDSETMNQIVSIARALTSTSPDAAASDEPADAADTPEAQNAPAPDAATLLTPQSPPQLDWGSILGLLGGFTGGGGSANPLGMLSELDPKMIQTAMRLFSEYSATDDRKITLLAALKPFLKEERYAKVDKAIQIAKLSRVIRVAFQLFKKDGEGETDV